MDEKTKTIKEQKKEKRRNFSRQMGAIILGTTISLFVTIGISEQELLEFIEMREKEVEVDREKPGDIIYTPNINPDGINTIHVPLSKTEN